MMGSHLAGVGSGIQSPQDQAKMILMTLAEHLPLLSCSRAGPFCERYQGGTPNAEKSSTGALPFQVGKSFTKSYGGDWPHDACEHSESAITHISVPSGTVRSCKQSTSQLRALDSTSGRAVRHARTYPWAGLQEIWHATKFGVHSRCRCPYACWQDALLKAGFERRYL